MFLLPILSSSASLGFSLTGSGSIREGISSIGSEILSGNNFSDVAGGNAGCSGADVITGVEVKINPLAIVLMVDTWVGFKSNVVDVKAGIELAAKVLIKKRKNISV